MRDIWRRLFGTLAGDEEAFEYKGDVFDTPPVWIRFLMAGACLFGFVMLQIYYAGKGAVMAEVLLSGGFALTLFLIFTVPRAGQTALVASLFWGLLGAFALFWPA